MEEINRQREIGKQILLINILKNESEKAARIGISFVSKEDIVQWTAMTMDEVEVFYNTYEKLQREYLAINAACKLRNNSVALNSQDLNSFLFYTYNHIDENLLKGYSIESFTKYCKDHAKENYERFQKTKITETREILGTINTFELIISNYLRVLVANVGEAFRSGYEWDVISEMLWCDITRADYDLLAKCYG